MPLYRTEACGIYPENEPDCDVLYFVLRRSKSEKPILAEYAENEDGEYGWFEQNKRKGYRIENGDRFATVPKTEDEERYTFLRSLKSEANDDPS